MIWTFCSGVVTGSVGFEVGVIVVDVRSQVKEGEKYLKVRPDWEAYDVEVEQG